MVSTFDESVSDEQWIEVVENKKMISKVKRIINYQGTPYKVKKNYRK